MEKTLSFWENADCEDCPVTHNDWRNENTSCCPFDETLYKHAYPYKVLECPHLKVDLEKDLESLMSSGRGFNSKVKSYEARASDWDYENMFVGSARSLMWLVKALEFKEKNKALEAEVKKLRKKVRGE